MTRSTPDDRSGIEIGRGITLQLSKAGTWEVCAKNGCFALQDTCDFFRVLVLLERPLEEVKRLIDDYAERQQFSQPFPMWRVVGAALASESREWIELATRWLPKMDAKDLKELTGALSQLRGARWATQQERQLADRYLRQAGRA